MLPPKLARGLSRAPFPDVTFCTLCVPWHPPQRQAGLLEDTATCCVWPPSTTRHSSSKLSHQSNSAKVTEHSQGCEIALSPHMHRQTDPHSGVSLPPPWLLRTELGLHPCPQCCSGCCPRGPPAPTGTRSPSPSGRVRHGSQDRHGQTVASTSHCLCRTRPFCPPTLLFSHTCSPPNHRHPSLSPPLVPPLTPQNKCCAIPKYCSSHPTRCPLLGQCSQSQSCSGVTQSPQLLTPKRAASRAGVAPASSPLICFQCWSHSPLALPCQTPPGLSQFESLQRRVTSAPT